MNGKKSIQKGDQNNQEAQEEYVDLQRRYKNIENDRKTFNDETQAQLKKQKNMIEKLQKENQQLKEEVTAQTSSIGRNKNATSQASTENIAEEIRLIQERIQEEKMMQEKMDDDIKTLQQEIIDQKRKQKGVNGTQERNSQLGKQIKILENRLDKANQKFNEAIAHNKQLRESIDSLRRERVIFDNIYRKLEKELHNKRKDMANIIEIANSAYEERDRAQEKLQMLVQQAEREKTEFEKEMQQVSNLIEKDKQMRELMKLKETEKSDLEKITLNKSEGFMGSAANLDEKRKTNKNWSTQKEKIQATVSLEKVESYEEAFAKIEAATGIHDIDVLVSNFIQAEEKNFALFKFVNELSNEIENLESQISDMQQEMERYKGQGQSNDNQRKKDLKALEEKLSKTEMKAEQLGLEQGQAQTKLNSIKSSIEQIFNVVQCEVKAHQELLGTQGVTDSNMMTYMGIIEQRINEVLQAYAYIQQQRQFEHEENAKIDGFNLAGAGPNMGATHGPLRIEPPSFGEDLSDDDLSDEASEKPLGIEEFKQRVENSKRNDSKKKKGKTQLKR